MRVHDRQPPGTPDGVMSAPSHRGLLAALLVAQLMVILDISAVKVALPDMAKDLGIRGADVGWVVTSYSLIFGSLLLLGGRAADLLGRRRLFLTGLSIFTVASFASAVSVDASMLFAARAGQGLGAAMLSPAALSIITTAFQGKARVNALGAWGAVGGAGAAIGVLMGGVLTDMADWRAIFYINLPVGAVSVAVISVFFHDPQRKKEPRTWKQILWQLDPIGTICFMPAIICLLLALHWGGHTYAWDNSRVTSLLMLCIVLVLVFLYVQYKMQENATVPPRIIKKRTVWSSAIFEFFIGACFLLSMYFLPIWFQAVKGASAVSSGVMNIPMLLSVVLFTVGSGIIVTSWGYYTPFIIGAAILMPIGYGLMSTLNKESSAAAWIGFQIIAGAGVGIGMQQPLTAVQVVLDIADVPTGTAIIIFAQSLGGALFVTAGQTVFSNRLTAFVMEYAPQVDPGVVLDAGATKIRDIIAAEYLDGVVHAFNSALSNCFLVSAATAAAAITGAVLVEWKSVKGKHIEMGAA